MSLKGFEESTKTSEHVTILRGPEPLKVDGVVIGTCQVTREVSLDFKTKLPREPREELVWLTCAPGIGRAQRVRLGYAVGALESLGFIGGDADDADADAETADENENAEAGA